MNRLPGGGFPPIPGPQVIGVELALPWPWAQLAPRSREDLMVVLEHATDDCTGNWRLVGTGDNRTIRCDRCEGRYAATPENRLAAIDENYAGIYLCRLTAEGAEIIDPDQRNAA
ncbi:MAG: hypothetical protein HY703_10110 [Gemmatimonadetes bacterium]|nr:hypothetical protein [Gemmatimonadota bacterium]